MYIRSFTFNPFQENMYVVYGDSKSAVIIDPGCFDRYEQEELADFIEDNGLTVKAIWNTHCHIDHVMGNAFCVEKYGVPISTHKGELFTLGYAERAAQMYGIPGYIHSPEPTDFLEEGQELVIDDIAFKVLLTPGHSVAHIAFYSEKENILIGGDTLFSNSYGRYDLPGGSLEILVDTITERLFKLPDNTVVYSGHGPATQIGIERQRNPILEYL